MKISIVIPYYDNNSKLDRSFEYIKKQDLTHVECEIILANSCQDKASMEKLSVIEDSDPDRVTIVGMGGNTSKADMLNVGMGYCSGDYIMFMRAGDAINPRLFAVIGELIDQNYPEIISYGMTYAHDKFDLYDDDLFDTDNFSVVSEGDRPGKLKYLMETDISDCYLAHMYRRDLLDDVGIKFSDTSLEEDENFAYPMRLLAESVAYTEDFGYCLFENREKKDVSARITERMVQQTNLFEIIRGSGAIYDEYKDEIDAHFIKEYFLRNLKLSRASRPDDRLKHSVFEVMQYVTLNLVPKWIENDYIFSLNKDDRELMLLIGRHFESDEELNSELRKDKLLTIITTTYNRCEKIRESIECILNQSWGYFEYLIVDDGSPDITAEVVGEYDDSRIKFIRNPENHGLCYSRNVGIKNSTGNYIVCQDDDDFCRLDKMEKEMGFMLGLSDDYGMVYCESINHTRRLAGITDQEAIIIPPRNMSIARKSGYIFPELLHKNYITATAGLFRRKCLDEVGMYDENLFGYEDWDLYLRIARKYEIGFVAKPLYDYYQRPGSLISNRDDEHRRKILKSLYDIDNKFVEDRKLYGIETSFKIVSE